MKTTHNLKKAIVIAALFVPIIMQAQQKATLNKSESQITITGTSTLHDWEENLTKFDCDLQFEAKGAELTNINQGVFKCEAKSIESESSLMSSKTYDALKADKYPEIKFSLKSFQKISSDKGNYTCVLVGDVTIAGVTRNVTIPVSGAIQGKLLNLKGSSAINLSDFGMEPPTALMGSIKVGNTISVNFSLGFSL